MQGDRVRNWCELTSGGGFIFKVVSWGGGLSVAGWDTGRGRVRGDQELLFGPLRRVGGSKSQAVQGTGLGLSIAKNLVEMMGGAISVESEPGRGTTFVVSIPEIRGDEGCVQSKTAGERQSYAHLGVTVLVVDDNEINLTVAEGLLTDLYGIRCDLAGSGEEALQKAALNEYSLIFMDQMMAGMDGVETAGKIREMGGKFATLPIIALTANAVKGTREALLEAGIDDYLSKPIDIEEMDRVLRRWLPPDGAAGS
mgnify:CR=1 FL=1